MPFKFNPEIKPGVYILFGYDDELSQPLAYIGEAENGILVESKNPEQIAKAISEVYLNKD